MRLRITVFGIIAFGSLVAGEEPVSIREYANTIRGMRAEHINRGVLPKGKEMEVLEDLRKDRDYPELFRLNDQPTIDEFIAVYRQKKGMDWMIVRKLERCCSPYILDELAPSLYEGPDFEQRSTTAGGDYHSDQGYAMTTAVAMGKIISQAPEFSEAVQKSVGTGVGPNLMRAWWEENQKALREGRYGEVNPIVKANLTPPSLPNPEDSKRVLPTPPTPQNGSQPSAQASPPTPSPVVLGAIEPPLQPSRQPLWFGVAALLATAAGWLFHRSKGKQH